MKQFDSERMKSAVWYFGTQLVYLVAWKLCGFDAPSFLIFSGATTAAYMTLLGVKTMTDKAKIRQEADQQ